MDLTHITSQSLRRVLNLTERKDELVKLVSELETEIAKSLTGAKATFGKAFSKAVSKPVSQPSKVAKKPAKARKGKRGGLKDRVLALLAAAGDKGLRVKDIASKLGTSTGNVSVWFSTTGKSLTTKLQPGRYAISAGTAVDVKPASSPARTAKVSSKVKEPAKKKRGLTAAGRARLSASMSARWAKRRAANAPVAKKGSKPSKS
ncbi:hypothetical protein M0Q28_07035 [Patescibacteria group bacterium]|jgi:uncharacterized protein YjcR|nr:hypothetical protein [Patescibacteria group bacterium]